MRSKFDSFESAQSASSKLNERLNSLGRKSYSKVSPVGSGYEIRLVLHPDERAKVQVEGIPTIDWPEGSDKGPAYVKRTPTTPSQNTDNYGFYPSPTRRKVDGPSSSPDINPAYPGLRRMPEIQDIVRRVAMRPDIKSRLNRVAHSLRALRALERVAHVSHGYDSESAYLVSELLAELKGNGHTGRTKIVRLTNKLKKAMESDGYSFKKKGK
jgi:hypothetical protein